MSRLDGGGDAARARPRPRARPAARKQAYHHGDLKNALIRAGAEILASEGTAGLTLRKAAQRAGVSPAAPYAHFADKRALVAAISTEGLRAVRDRIAAATSRHAGDPLRQLVEAAWETMRFGLQQPDHYRVTFSNVIEQEADFPAYVEMAHASFEALVDLVRAGQAAGVVGAGPPDVTALGLWSLVHGLVSLLINRQVPQRLLSRASARNLLTQALTAHLRPPAVADGPSPGDNAT
jgi:AcrR family transcriptional regulator